VFALGVGFFLILANRAWDFQALVYLNPGLALMTIGSVTVPPAWAFKHAHRMSRPVWLLIGVVSALVPPLGFIFFAVWAIGGRAVVRAWAAEDPGSYYGHALTTWLARL
jgi:hypothetical protein